MSKPYSNYMLEDLITNQSFRKWIKDPDSDQDDFWQEWLYQYPEKAALVTQARQIILDLSDDDRDEPFEEEIADVWKKIVQTNTQTSQKQHQNNSFRFFSARLQWVAVLIGALISGALVWSLLSESSGQVQYLTHYGEIKTIRLPDSSVIQLNANSQIRFASHWSATQTREIWLQGEAFFAVMHTAQHQLFLVHTPEVTVHVSGTTFNVNTRRKKAKIILSEGKVQLTPHVIKRRSVIEMQPGDFVEVDNLSDTLIRRRVNPDNYTAWKQNKLVFEDAVLSEIATVLEDDYGYKVYFKDKELANLMFTGSVTRDKLPLLFTILEKTFQIHINRDGNKLTISRSR